MNRLSKVEFHVDRNVKPRHIEEILPFLKKGIFITKKTLLSEFNSYGYTIHQRHLGKNLLVLRYFGIIKWENRGFSLTQLGLSLQKRLNFGRDVFYDLMHYLYYTAWHFGDRKRMHFSWSYKTICDLLWERKSTLVNRKKLAGELLAAAQEEFRSGKISISHEAITGIFNWLSALDPPFIEDTRKNKIGRGRTRCSPELFILAIDYLYHMLNLSHKVPGWETSC